MMNYTDLLERVQSWMENYGGKFVASIPHAITLAEARIGRELGGIQAMRQTGVIAVTAGSPTIAKPSGAIAMTWLRFRGEEPLQFRDLSFMLDFWPNPQAVGEPRFYGWADGNTLHIAPTPDAMRAATDLLGEWVVHLSGLSEAMPSTWISENHPDLLFYAVLLESSAFEKAQDDEARYLALYDRALQSAKAEVARVRADGSNIYQ